MLQESTFLDNNFTVIGKVFHNKYLYHNAWNILLNPFDSSTFNWKHNDLLLYKMRNWNITAVNFSFAKINAYLFHICWRQTFCILPPSFSCSVGKASFKLERHEWER